MKADAPCFLFWPKDWLSALKTRSLSLEARGAYIDLIAHCWLEGTVPSSPSALARILGISEDAATELRHELEPCFDDAGDGAWRQPRVERERSRQTTDREQKRNAGKASARARAERRGNGAATDAEREGNGG